MSSLFERKLSDTSKQSTDIYKICTFQLSKTVVKYFQNPTCKTKCAHESTKTIDGSTNQIYLFFFHFYITMTTGYKVSWDKPFMVKLTSTPAK